VNGWIVCGCGLRWEPGFPGLCRLRRVAKFQKRAVDRGKPRPGDKGGMGDYGGRGGWGAHERIAHHDALLIARNHRHIVLTISVANHLNVAAAPIGIRLRITNLIAHVHAHVITHRAMMIDDDIITHDESAPQ